MAATDHPPDQQDYTCSIRLDPAPHCRKRRLRRNLLRSFFAMLRVVRLHAPIEEVLTLYLQSHMLSTTLQTIELFHLVSVFHTAVGGESCVKRQSPKPRFDRSF